MDEITKKCDICKKVIDMSRWEDTTGALYIKHTQSSQNILKHLQNAEGNFQTVTIRLNDLCYECQRITSKKILDMLTNKE